MDKKEVDVLEQQRRRRKRVERIRTSIVMMFVIWFLVSILSIVILAVQVVRLNSRLSEVELQLTSMASTSEANDISEELTESSDTADKESSIVTGIDLEDNFAKEGDSHRVYLTFDCNPSTNTEKIMDALDKYDVKATFFTVGSKDKASKSIYNRIVKDGHTLGMNSYSNQYSTIYSSTKAFEEDYGEISDFLYNITGVKSLYYRFPGGSNNEISNVNMQEFVKILNKHKVTYFDYNVSSGDLANNCSVDSIVKNTVSGVRKYKTSVVLLHDDVNRSTTAKAIEPLIKALKKMDAEILPIDDKTYVVQYIKADSVE